MCSLVRDLQAELSRPGRDDGGAAYQSGSFYHYALGPMLVPEFAKRWQRYSRPVGTSWRCDETYIRLKGKWVYLYRAVDRGGQTVDFFLSEQRDIAAAKRFFQQAVEKRGAPEKITLDGYAASHEAVAKLQE
jgi:transposase-like protein